MRFKINFHRISLSSAKPGYNWGRGGINVNVRVMSAKVNAGKDSGDVIKNYHKQAFECISKALRIDEDDTGLFAV